MRRHYFESNTLHVTIFVNKRWGCIKEARNLGCLTPPKAIKKNFGVEVRSLHGFEFCGIGFDEKSGMNNEQSELLSETCEGAVKDKDGSS